MPVVDQPSVLGDLELEELVGDAPACQFPHDNERCLTCSGGVVARFVARMCKMPTVLGCANALEFVQGEMSHPGAVCSGCWARGNETPTYICWSWYPV